MKPYWKYFKYVLQHKKNVFKECWSTGEYLHAFTHDLSKFRPSEFIPYARYFYIDKDKYQADFERAWRLHYTRNKHHPEYFGSTRYMGLKNIRHMVCDLRAMSRQFGGSAEEYYLSNYYKWDMSKETREMLEIELDLIPWQQGEERTIGEILTDFNNPMRLDPEILERKLNDYLDIEGLNVYSLLQEARVKR